MKKILCFGLMVLMAGLVWGKDPAPKQQAELPPDLKLFSIGYGSALDGKWKEALDTFAEIETKYPASQYLDRVLFWKSWCHTELKNYGKAIKFSEELIEKYPKSAYADDALFKIGEIYEYYQHDYEKALSTYERLVKLFPTPDGSNQDANSNASNNAVAAQQQKAQIEERRNPKQALNEWQNSQELSNRLNRGRATKEDFFTRRAQERISFITANSDNDYLPLTRFSEGELYCKEGKYDEALKKFREIIKEFPDSSLADNAAYEIGICLRQQKMDAEAQEAMQKFIQAYPKSELLAKAQEQLEKWDAEKEQKKPSPPASK